ncbi:MAG: hypothetical protein ACKVX7_08760, partial [Planctomycetota bacterium]
MTLRQPQAEQLESRRLLTADVFVHVDNKGHLLLDDIAGTSSNITVKYNKTTNEFLVTAKTDELTTDKVTFTDHVRVSGALVSRGLIANLGDGNDSLDLPDFPQPTTVFGGTGNDTILGGKSGDFFDGEDGDDVLHGRVGDDTISGGLGDDTLRGGDGADFLDGGDDNDIVDGQNGNDTLQAGTGTDSIEGGCGGVDLFVQRSNVSSVKLTNSSLTGLGTLPEDVESFTGIERVLLIGGDDANSIDASAASMSVTLVGGLGDDVLFGGGGKDLVVGGDGSDTLDGGGRNDTLEGGGVNDAIAGLQNFNPLNIAVESKAIEAAIGSI